MSNSAYPAAIDTFVDPNPTDLVAVVNHAGQHSVANDALSALETKLGVTNSAVSASIDYKVNQLSNFNNTLLTDTGSANAYVLTPSPAIPSYVAGQSYQFIPANANTGTSGSTLNVSGLGTKAIQYGGQAVSGGQLATNFAVRVIYDGTAFQLQNPATLVLGSAKITTNFNTTSTSATQVTGLTVTCNVPAGKYVRITAFCGQVSNGTVSDAAVLTVWRGTVGSGTQINQSVYQNSSASLGSGPGIVPSLDIPTPGTVTYNVGFNASGGGTASLNIGTTTPATLTVELV